MNAVKPTVGCIVHFVEPKRPTLTGGYNGGPENPRAAIVVHVHPGGRALLQVFAPHREPYQANAEYSEAPAAGTWHWPPRGA